MKLTLRFVLPLAIVLAIIGYAVIPLVDILTLRWFVRDLDMRSKLIVSTLEEPLSEIIPKSSPAKLAATFDRATKDERLLALAYCDNNFKMYAKTPHLPEQVDCQLAKDRAGSSVLNLPGGPLHVSMEPVVFGGKTAGTLLVVHDMSFITRRSADTRKYIFYLFLVLSGIISLVTVVTARLSWRGWMSSIRSLIRGEILGKRGGHGHLKSRDLLPLAKDLRALVRDLEADRRARDESQITWTSKKLRSILHEDLAGEEIMIVSNREPYIHVKKGSEIEVQVPASGLVTALEPVMRACSGTWVAHGSGSADRQTVDKKDHVRVPPENPAYQIRRVWLTPEEEAGYYYGFSNEGLWPLCHIAHARPVFRTSDWEIYRSVNQKFADIVVEEAKTREPVILVQDYHFALLPRMIREQLPNATILTFWHIPWPNPEAFGICPWREEILEGLLGSSILGFHTAFHCHNFMDTVDRFLEARANRENSTLSFGGKLTAVRPYPISIEWPSLLAKGQPPVADCRASIRKENDLPLNMKVGVGVDRLDYTKGILERFLAVERFLELHPDWIGKFSFIQIAAPSRTSIIQYKNLDAEVRALAEKINARFGKDGYRPILLKIEHHEPEEVFQYYRGSDVCMVTSLHDGMNLVAKEFVAAHDDERGVLILSQFTGAARELPESLVVNPYNIDECASALEIAVTMPDSEQRDRMRSMRGLIQEYNVYRWAGRMLLDAARMRQRRRLLARLHDSIRPPSEPLTP